MSFDRHSPDCTCDHPECTRQELLQHEIDRLKEELDAVECSHDDEEAAHLETLAMLKFVQTQRDTLLAMLKRLEWSGDDGCNPCCPDCGEAMGAGHAAGCELNAILAAEGGR